MVEMIAKYGVDMEEPSAGPSKGKEVDQEKLLPVTLLCGFLGAGKTTLLKHILETKHANEDFKCAVIVNDMAALNIDKSLIDQSALVQSDEVIAMQNGCFCCTLQNDLVEQIITLAKKNMFNYMLIEASGVSEPSQIAPLFELCEDEHDHEEEHKEGPELGEVARLDTCVTVVDSAEFYSNLASMKVYEEGEIQGTIAELLTEQVEFSNVVILNKQDLVTKEQQRDILDRVSLLNPKAKVLKSQQSKIDVMEILNTKLFDRADMEEDSVMISATKVEATDSDDSGVEKDCCIESVKEAKKKCCKSKKSNLIESKVSSILLGVIPQYNKNSLTRHETRFGITSFVYRSRRPFHPGRLYDEFLEPYFMLRYQEEEGPETRSHLQKMQKKASEKQAKRVEVMGELLRSKGFVWLATSHFIIGGWQQAGNVLRLEAEGPWMIEDPKMWEGTPAEELIRKDMTKEDGTQYEFGDRRQEMVFIGMDLKHQAMQKALDQCLLTDEEMKMKPIQWFEKWEAIDKLKFALDDEDDEEEDDEDGEGEEEELPEEIKNQIKETVDELLEEPEGNSPSKKRKRNNGEPKAAMKKKSAADAEGTKPTAARKKSNRKKN